jgi:hypothetical protein
MHPLGWLQGKQKDGIDPSFGSIRRGVVRPVPLFVAAHQLCIGTHTLPAFYHRAGSVST